MAVVTTGVFACFCFEAVCVCVHAVCVCVCLARLTYHSLLLILLLTGRYREGHCDIITYLLDMSPHCWNTQSKNGRTPLHTAGKYMMVTSADSDKQTPWELPPVSRSRGWVGRGCVCYSDANDAHCTCFLLSALHGKVDTLRVLRERYELELSKY